MSCLYILEINPLSVGWSKSEREKEISYTNMYVWNLERWYWWNYLQGSNAETGFPGSLAGNKSACKARDPSLIPGSGSSPGEGIGYLVQYSWASLVAQTVKNPPAMWKTWVWSLGWEDSLESMATNSSILAQRISMDRGAWQTVYSPWSCKELDATEWLSTASPYQRIHTLAEDTKN